MNPTCDYNLFDIDASSSGWPMNMYMDPSYFSNQFLDQQPLNLESNYVYDLLGAQDQNQPMENVFF